MFVLAMDRVSVLCVLLLLCSLSGAELQDNEIMNVQERSQPCPSDLHTVLREMTAKLAVLQTKMEQLQTLNQEQAAKLSELEKQTSPMKLQLQVHNTYLKSFKNTLNTTVNHVEALRRDKAVARVAFSASLLESGDGCVGPFSRDTPLEFKRVFSNIGNAYNRNTGFFIAPLRGAYYFDFHAGAGGRNEDASSVWLTKNGERIVHAYEHQTNGYGSTGNGATLLLQPGDMVSLIVSENNRMCEVNQRCTFSGHLLFTV